MPNQHLGSILTVLLAAAGVLIPCCLVLQLAAQPLFRRAGAVSGVGLNLSFAGFLVLLPALFTTWRLSYLSPAPLPWSQLAAAATLCFWSLASVFLIGRSAKSESLIFIFSLVAPWLGLLILMSVWLPGFQSDRLWSTLTLLNLAGLALSGIGIFYLGRKASRLPHSSPKLLGFSLIAFLMVIAAFLAPQIDLPERTAQSPPGPIQHVFLIVVDTLRADSLSVYNPDKDTPSFARLASDSIVFERAISPSPWTKPSMVSIMTGLPPTVHGVYRTRNRAIDELPMLAEHMRDAGYRTSVLGINEMISDPRQGLFQGFDDVNFFPWVPANRSVGESALARILPRYFRDWSDTQQLTDLAIDWVQTHANQPFFYWLHYFDPHLPYAPPRAMLKARQRPRGMGWVQENMVGIRIGRFAPRLEQREWLKALYDAEVKLVDQHLGRFLSELDRLGIYDDSLIVLTSDHGEEFWEHGGFEHGHSLYQELLWVPLFVKLPHSENRGRVSHRVTTQQIAPTVLDACRITPSIRIPGSVSLFEGLVQDETQNSTPIFSTGTLYYEEKISVIFGDTKYISSPMSKREELYDLGQDPGERSSLVSESPAKLEQARTILSKHRSDAKQLRATLYLILKSGVHKLHPDTIKRLKALGYVQ